MHAYAPGTPFVARRSSNQVLRSANARRVSPDAGGPSGRSRDDPDLGRVGATAESCSEDAERESMHHPTSPNRELPLSPRR